MIARTAENAVTIADAATEGLNTLRRLLDSDSEAIQLAAARALLGSSIGMFGAVRRNDDLDKVERQLAELELKYQELSKRR